MAKRSRIEHLTIWVESKEEQVRELEIEMQDALEDLRLLKQAKQEADSSEVDSDR